MEVSADDEPQPTMACPRCGRLYEDFDGVGVLYCLPPEGCGYCRHASKSALPGQSMRCDYCGLLTDRA